MKKHKIVAVLGGGDWFDASVDHLILLGEVDLYKEKIRWLEWYNKEYAVELMAGKKPDYYTFIEMLIKQGLARRCTKDEVVEFIDD